jgi:hypothetical protein
MKKGKHPGADVACTNETMPGRPGTATPKKTSWTDGDADSGYGISTRKRKAPHQSSENNVGAYPSGHTTTRVEEGAKSKGPRNPLKERGYETKY